MKFFVLSFTLLLLLAATTFSSASDIDQERRDLAKLKDLITSPTYSAARNLTLQSLPGCLTMSNCKICGNFCGPHYCGAADIAETNCVATGLWAQVASATGSDDCVDACCRWHDHCCGAGTDRETCNTGIVSCIDNNNCGGLCAFAVHTALKIVSSFCCGSRCPSYSADENGNFVPMDLAGKKFCHRDGKLALAFSADTSRAPNSPDSNIYNFNVKMMVTNSEDGTEEQQTMSVTLHQHSNRVHIGVPAPADANSMDAVNLLKIPASIQAAHPFAAGMAKPGAKIWYFPYTEELFMRDMNGENKYETFVKC